MKKQFEMRAVQIDLARQIETMETVKEFFDVSAKAGMNTIVMYLEDRVKTASYPYSPDTESYSAEQIKELVAYADTLGLELVPVVSPIGHAERFLRHPELKGLAELREGGAGLFTPANSPERWMDTCPNLPEATAFMDTYITEVAALFPGRYFHIGFDEIHDMGFCSLCKDTPVPELFYNALMHYYKLLKGLGKEVMIWDDMAEQVVDLLDRLPKDIILCAWFYQHTERYPHARFCTSRCYDYFEEYERKGFRYLASCWRGNSMETLTRYARKKNPMGMLMTNWEMSDERQIKMLYPFITLAGKLWTEGAPITRDTLLAVTRQYADTEAGAEALAVAMTEARCGGLTLPGEKAKYHEPSEFAYSQKSITESTLKALTCATGDADVIEAYRLIVERLALRFRLWETGFALHEYRANEGTEDIETIRAAAAECVKEAARVRELVTKVWRKYRPAFDMTKMEKSLAAVDKAAAWLAEAADKATTADHGRLVLMYHLQEYTASMDTRVTLHYADGSTYEAAYGNYKGADLRNPLYAMSFEVPADKVPTAVTLSAAGFGAVGFRYLSVTLPDGTQCLPCGVAATAGVVEHPEFMLTDDSRPMNLGEQEMLQAFTNQYPYRRPHSATIALKVW